MADIADTFEFHEASLMYVDGPQEGFLRERATGRWYRFRCLRLGSEQWLYGLVVAPAPHTDRLSDGLDWTPDRVFVQCSATGAQTIVEFVPKPP